MALVVFYEKPGCRNNTRQKALLRAARHTVEARDLLAVRWTPDTLRPFFGRRPVAEWFNRAAPRVKSGEVDPAALTADEALALMVADPLLIRRPLLDVDGRKDCGFDVVVIGAWIGLGESAYCAGDLQGCPRAGEAAPCPTP